MADKKTTSRRVQCANGHDVGSSGECGTAGCAYNPNSEQSRYLDRMDALAQDQG